MLVCRKWMEKELKASAVYGGAFYNACQDRRGPVNEQRIRAAKREGIISDYGINPQVTERHGY